MLNKILIMFFCTILILQSQDRYPEPFEFEYEVNNILGNKKPLNRGDFEQNSFIISTQWWGHTKMLKALKFNSNSGTNGFPLGANLYNPTLYQEDQSEMYYIGEWKAPNYSIAFQYEPTLFIHSDQRGNFITKDESVNEDVNKSIYGFS